MNVQTIYHIIGIVGMIGVAIMFALSLKSHSYSYPDEDLK